MGSRLMHLIIGELVASELTFLRNKGEFLIGSIAPDAAFSFERKVSTHYFEGNVVEGTRQVNYQRYIDTYISEKIDDYSLGYLTHLISDSMWMEYIYYPYEVKQKQNLDPNFLQRWYSDFRKMNTKLLCHYNMIYLKDWLKIDALPRLIDDITQEDLQKFIEEMYVDFEIIEENIDCKLEVYNFKDIVEYINLSKSKAIKVIENINYLVP
ncbi:zinc dependent phospholipase C family protein [Bacillus suaedaesalsae]|uniref:Zinc dependent phospholipase C family protein n=1 Tax=Bacillus suaedaesalsae TaxID=2810349 RepID=A0ABS2DH34_9BACI|nr:zinc dependent phospholipase C family protein [Bacillus suaedaesalsae]MBM6617796.1 zinc dependent phospholipase C family protein [Bacillus suaedaesalsae]